MESRKGCRSNTLVKNGTNKFWITAIMSILGFAARPGTDVDPT